MSQCSKGGINGSSHAYSRHCEQPTVEPVEGIVQGRIPEWINGTLIRNGPGILNIGEDKYPHVFDGLAILHRYHISNGLVTYTSRPLQSDAYKKNMGANRIMVSGFGTVEYADPCQTIFQRFQSKFSTLLNLDKHMTDNCNVSVCYLGDQLYTMTETNYMRRIDPKSLDTIGEKTFLRDYLAINHSTAHPHILRDGSILNMGNNFSHKRGPHYCIVKISPSWNQHENCLQNAKIVMEIPFPSIRFASYYHSFGLIKDKVVFIESPYRMDILRILKATFSGLPMSSTLSWDENIKTKIHVVSLTDGSLHNVQYEADSLFVFHHINAYEEKDHIVMDVAGYDTAEGLMEMMTEKRNVNVLKGINTTSSARRFVLPLTVHKDSQSGQNLVTLGTTSAKAVLKKQSTGRIPVISCEPEQLTKSWMDLPRINYHFNGEKYNYFYGVMTSPESTWGIMEPDTLVKVNISRKTETRWTETNKIPTEPIFVRNPNSSELDEDSGVILSALMHKDDERAATLLILNATDFKEIARIQFHLPGAFTNTFHGQWANSEDKIHFY